MNPRDESLATGSLYLVATPIGNLGDCSPRAKETLATCDLIACEDTRVTAKLLFHLGVKVPTTSYREENERRKAPELVDRIEELKAMQPMVMCCESGNRSGQAVSYLSSNGFEKVYNGGGWMSVDSQKS